jgi:hypothetical protein
MSIRQGGQWGERTGGETQVFGMALELLAGCGMIPRVGFRISPDYPRRGELSLSKDYTLAISESLNLSAGKRV